MKKGKLGKQLFTAMGITINVVGAFLAMSLKLPIYLDSLGTIMVSAILGPIYGMATGFLGGMVSGITFDVYSFYFAWAQALTGLSAGLLFHKSNWLKGKRKPIGAMIITLPTSIVSAFITAGLFGGLTSSGSSILVILLSKLGMNLTFSVFTVQVITDFTDKYLAVILITSVLLVMTGEMKTKLLEE